MRRLSSTESGPLPLHSVAEDAKGEHEEAEAKEAQHPMLSRTARLIRAANDGESSLSYLQLRKQLTAEFGAGAVRDLAGQVRAMFTELRLPGEMGMGNWVYSPDQHRLVRKGSGRRSPDVPNKGEGGAAVGKEWF